MTKKQVRAYDPDMKGRRHADQLTVNDRCFVDASYNLLPVEFGDMFRRVMTAGYETWNWPDYKAYLIGRISRRGYLLPDSLDYWGQQIAAKSTPDFMGYQILQGLEV
jgi:hypothetical protein